jgi:sugar phosphate isomerase/epimerase
VVTPPVIGTTFLFDHEGPVRKGKALIDMAVSLECPFVRVFGFRASESESIASAVGRITDRLGKVVDYARNSGVSILIENGGSFESAAQLSMILDAIDHPLLLAAYSLPVARLSGERPAHGVNVLGEKLRTVKVKDFSDGVPCALGAGSCDVEQSIKEVASTGFDGWVVFEHDRLWFKELGDPSAILEAGCKSLYRWLNSTGSGHRSPVSL